MMDVQAVSCTAILTQAPDYRTNIPPQKSCFARMVSAVFQTCTIVLNKLDHYIPATRLTLGTLTITPLASPVTDLLIREHQRTGERQLMQEEHLDVTTKAETLADQNQLDEAAHLLRTQAQKLQQQAATHAENANAAFSRTSALTALVTPSPLAIITELPWTMMAVAINYTLCQLAHDSNCASEAELATSERHLSEVLEAQATRLEEKAARHTAMLEQQTKIETDHRKALQQLHTRLNQANQKAKNLKNKLKNQRPARITVSRHKARMETAERMQAEAERRLNSMKLAFQTCAEHATKVEGSLKQERQEKEQLRQQHSQLQNEAKLIKSRLEAHLKRVHQRLQAMKSRVFEAEEALQCAHTTSQKERALIKSKEAETQRCVRIIEKHSAELRQLRDEVQSLTDIVELLEEDKRQLSQQLQEKSEALQKGQSTLEIARKKQEILQAALQEEKTLKESLLSNFPDLASLHSVDLSGRLYRRQGKSHILGFLFQVFQHPVSILLFILLLPFVYILASIFEHTIHQPGKLMSCGGDSLGSPKLAPFSSIECAQSTFRISQSISGYPESGSCCTR